MAEFGVPGVKYCRGISLDLLQSVDPFAVEEDLFSMDRRQAESVVAPLWVERGMDLISDRALAIEAFCFSLVYGESAAAWILDLAASKVEITKGYAGVHQIPEGRKIDRDLAVRLSKSGHALKNFRMLQAWHIGWLHRTY